MNSGDVLPRPQPMLKINGCEELVAVPPNSHLLVYDSNLALRMSPQPSMLFSMNSTMLNKDYSRRLLWSMGLLVCLTGCGTTKSYTATEQLLMSDAVDATVAKLDFEPLTAKKVYLDTTFLKTQKSPLLIDSDYVISSLRQQMMAAGVQLVENREEADLIAEARMGALGLDGHNVTYGLPASNILATATSAFSSAPAIPSIPEISFARRDAKSGAAKRRSKE